MQGFMNIIRDILRDIRRGAGYLPEVGEHPGLPVFIVMIIIAGMAGMQSGDGGSLKRALTGSLGMLILFGPVFAHGCISRARLNDQLVRKKQRG